jgi:hypothetical protein
MPLYYTAVHRFDSACAGDRWRDYIAWSGLEQLCEVVSLDQLLCPNFFESPTIEDLEHSLQEEDKLHLFRELEYVLRRTRGQRCFQVLGVIPSPAATELRIAHDPRLELCGFDLLDGDGASSALVNCSGFERSFSNQELNSVGLISEFERAVEVRDCLSAEHPHEPRAQCNVWAIYRYMPGS